MQFVVTAKDGGYPPLESALNVNVMIENDPPVSFLTFNTRD